MSVDFELDTDADDARLARWGQLTDRYRMVARSLAQPPQLTVRRA